MLGERRLGSVIRRPRLLIAAVMVAASAGARGLVAADDRVQADRRSWLQICEHVP